MTPKNRNILDVLNLLTLLFRVRKQAVPKLSDEEQHTLTVTKEHLQGANLSIPIFINTLNTLADKGYLTAVSIFEKEYHQKMRDAFVDDNFNLALGELSRHGLDKLSSEQKIALGQSLEKLAPPQYKLDTEALIKSDISYKDFLDDAKVAFEKHSDEDISKIILFPFRDIDLLLEKMNNGSSFDEVQDSSIWYDGVKYEFHVGDDVIPTSYQGKPNVEHYVFEKLYDCFDDGVIGYEDIDGHKRESLKSNLQKFIKKHKRLRKIFKIRKDRLEFDKEAFN